MLSATHRYALYLGCLLAASLTNLAAAADAASASRDAERQAKTAVPSAEEALIYVYRAADTLNMPLEVRLAGAQSMSLAPGTFAVWRVKPRRQELSVERGNTIALQSEGGRVYYVELARTQAGTPVLRSVSFAAGRAQVQRSRLAGPAPAPARPPATAARPAPARRASSAPAPEDNTRGALMLKLGSFSLSENNQTILGNTQQFNSSASSVMAIEGEWFFQPDLSLGGEFLQYSNSFTAGGTSINGQADTTVFLVNIKRYFVLAEGFKPYIGAGGGFASTDFSGAITGSTSGPALQLAGGVQWRRGSFALRGEYKYLRAKTEDDNSQRVDMSGSGIFLGAGFYF